MLPSLGGRGRNGVGMVNLSETSRPSVTQSQALPRSVCSTTGSDCVTAFWAHCKGTW